MGDVSVIARRIPGGYVQYGWSGNGGFCRNVGFRVLLWYTEPEPVEQLFDLGQTSLIGKPGSENGGEPWHLTHRLTGEPFWLGKTERDIFSRLAFVDHGYFYDSDNRWYYIIPEPFRIKIPLEHIADHLDEEQFEFAYCREIKKKLAAYILGEYLDNNKDFRDYLIENTPADQSGFAEKIAEIKEKILTDDDPLYDVLYRGYRYIYDYFDDWVVAVPTEEDLQFKLKKDSDEHIETINW